MLSWVYHEWLHLFSRDAAAKLPEHTEYNHNIDLLEGNYPP